MLEKNLVKQVMKYLKTLPEAHFEKKFAGAANPGDPDISGCIRGRCVKIEMKRPGNKPTALQESKLKQWERAGAIVGVAHSLEEVKEVLSDYI